MKKCRNRPFKEALNKLIPLMVRQARHERNQHLTVRPEPVEGLNQSFLNIIRLDISRVSGKTRFSCLTATGLGIILLLMPTTATALGLNCNVSATGVAFGNYDATSSSPTDATGNVQVTCTVLVVSVLSTTNISLNMGGSGSYSPRKMSSGGNLLNYNLYKEASHTTVWGDGTGGTGVFTDSLLIAVLGTTINHTIFGSIPAGQYVAAGAYTDTITVMVEFHEGL